MILFGFQIAQEESERLQLQERELHETDKRKLASQVKTLSEDLASKNARLNELEVLFFTF